MHLGIDLLFDDDSKRRIHRIERAVHALLRRDPPVDYPLHVRLTSFEGDAQGLPASLEQLASTFAPVSLRFDIAGTFPQGTVFIAPSDTGALQRMHGSVHGEMAGLDVGRNPYYEVDNWHPHCTVAILVAPDRLGDAQNVCAAELPCDLTVDSLALIEYPAAIPRHRFPLIGMN